MNNRDACQVARDIVQILNTAKMLLPHDRQTSGPGLNYAVELITRTFDLDNALKPPERAG